MVTFSVVYDRDPFTGEAVAHTVRTHTCDVCGTIDYDINDESCGECVAAFADSCNEAQECEPRDTTGHDDGGW